MSTRKKKQRGSTRRASPTRSAPARSRAARVEQADPAPEVLTADQRDESVRAWIAEVLGPVEVSFDPPADELEGSGVNVYLLDLQGAPPTHRPERRSQLVMLGYLVSTWARTPGEAHRLLAELLFAVLEHPEFVAEAEPVDPVLWSSFGIYPRPAFMLRAPLHHVRELAVAPRVRREAEVVETPLESLHGKVVGPGGVPLARAKVHIPTHRLSATTDADGEFVFPAVPLEPRSAEIVVRARGLEISANAILHRNDGRPVVIHIDNLET